jgi:hypothetical protein
MPCTGSRVKMSIFFTPHILCPLRKCGHLTCFK